MIRRFIIPLALLLAFALGIGEPVAHAQPVGDAEAVTSDSTYADTAARGNAEDETSNQTFGSGSDSTASKSPTPLPAKPPGGDTYAEVIQWIMKLFAWLLGVAVITLDNTVYYTVVKMGSYVNELSAVGVAWRIMRDIGNIMLIFGFLAAGLFTVLNLNLYGWGKSMLPKLLMAAVLLNFSLFMVEAVVDVGNLFATQFYTQINGGVAPGAAEFSVDAVRNNGIANKVMAQLGLQSLYGDAATNPDLLKAGPSWIIGFLGIILFIIAAFVFFTLAFILIARFVMLIYLIITAPIGFAGWAVPKLSGLSTTYWKNLFEQTITAPVLLLLLYIALAVITDASFLAGFGASRDSNTGFWTSLANGATNPSGFAGMLLSFLVAMGLLLAVAMAAKKLSAVGASGAMKLAGAATFGATAWAGRGVGGTIIGRGLLGNRLIKRGAVSDNKLIRYASRGASLTGRFLQNRTYDVRNAPLKGMGLGMVPHVETGAPSKLTAKQVQEKQYGLLPVREWFRNASMQYEKDAKELERKRNLKDSTSDEFKSEIKKMSADELSELRGIRKGMDNFVSALTPGQYSALMKGSKLLNTEKENLKGAWEKSIAGDPAKVRKMSVDDLTELSGIREGESALVAQLSVSKYNDLQKSDKLRDTEKDVLKKSWEERFDTTDSLKGMSPEDTAQLDSAILTKDAVMEQLSVAELEAMRRKGALKKEDRKKIHDNRKAHTWFDDYLDNDASGGRRGFWDAK